MYRNTSSRVEVSLFSVGECFLSPSLPSPPLPLSPMRTFEKYRAFARGTFSSSFAARILQTDSFSNQLDVDVAARACALPCVRREEMLSLLKVGPSDGRESHSRPPAIRGVRATRFGDAKNAAKCRRVAFVRVNIRDINSTNFGGTPDAREPR